MTTTFAPNPQAQGARLTVDLTPTLRVVVAAYFTAAASYAVTEQRDANGTWTTLDTEPADLWHATVPKITTRMHTSDRFAHVLAGAETALERVAGELCSRA